MADWQAFSLRDRSFYECLFRMLAEVQKLVTRDAEKLSDDQSRLSFKNPLERSLGSV